ncbi:MAG: glycosyltransferase family 39 protein [Actinobacteria bacterium]|nr:glycosyltransferase family 39 protein [Actinomycetota bacterium]
MRKVWQEKRYVYLLALLVGAFAVIHFVINVFLGIHIDEACWWLLSKHLSAGYFFHPPFIAFELAFLVKLFGDSPAALRLGSLVFVSASLPLFYLLCVEFFGDRKRAFYSTLVLSLLPITNYWLMIANQDAPFIFFWLLTVLLAWRAISGERRYYWYLAGLSSGLLMLCKLQSALIFLGLLLFLATRREGRAWLRRKEPYLAFLIVMVMFIPTLVWYARHDFQPIIYQLSNRPGFVKHGLFDYVLKIIKHVGWEMMVLTPFVYLLSIFGVVHHGYLGFRKKKEASLYLFWLSATVIVFFTITGGPPYWSFPGHIISLLAGAASLPVLLEKASSRFIARWWRFAAVVLCMVVPLLVSSYVIGFALTRSQLHVGWDEIAEEVRRVRQEMDSPEVYLAGPYHFLVNGIAYRLKEGVDGYTLLFRVYETENFGVDTTYDPWVYVGDLVGKDVVFVDEEDNPDDYFTPSSYWEEKLPPYFARVEGPEVFRVMRGGEVFRTFYIFRCYGFKGPDGDMDRRGDIRDYLERTGQD